MDGLHTRNRSRVRPLRAVDGQKKRPRTPGVAYALLTVALAVLVGALALTSRHTSPPTIAEFAPQAAEQITDSARDQSASAGAGAEFGPQGGIDPATGQPRDVVVDVARVRQCVGDPPRQIEDPQSPPCVPYWSGDNGGATSRGVTRDEIRLVGTSFKALDPSLPAFFNKRFEFYGRQIRLIPRSVPGDPAGQRAAAQAVYDQDRAFASAAGYGAAYDYFDELARLGIIGANDQARLPEKYLASRHPHLWTYTMANDRMFAYAGNWYCARFAGRNAVHSSDPFLQQTRRKPGILLTYAGGEGTSADPMDASLAACGEQALRLERSVSSFSADGQAFFQNAMLQMKTSGVTTVACLCEILQLDFIMHAARRQGYFPEWLVTSYILLDANGEINAHVTPGEQTLMALSMQPMQHPFADHPSTWATLESANKQALTANEQSQYDQAYRTLLLIASGIQMAGPRLTPETFARGLHRTTFPNPPHPLMAGSVGFTDGDHTMTDDAAEMWWSQGERGPYPDDTSTYCYVDHGARRRIGTFPTDDPFFKGKCDNGAN